jgi:hypothetical protein
MRRSLSALLTLFVCLLVNRAVSDDASAHAAAAGTPAAAAADPAKPVKPAPPKKADDQSTPKLKSYFVEVVDLATIRVVQRQGGTDTVLALPSVNASDVADALGSDDEFSLKAVGKDKIAIYYKGSSRKNLPAAELANLEGAITNLASAGYKYSELLRVRRGQASVVAKNVNSMNLPGITASAVSASQILLMSPSFPDVAFLAELRQRIYDSRWDVSSFSPVQRVFHLDASATVKSLTGSADSGSGSDKKSTDKSSDSSDSSKSGSTISSSSAASPSSTASPSISVTLNNAQPAKPAADDASPDDSGSPDSASKKSPKTAKSKADGSNPDKPSDQIAKVPKMIAVNDMVVYSNPDGTDDGILERNRLLAVLDLPRPEVLLNVWSLQASSRSAAVINTQAEVARQLVEHHNEALQYAIDRGWEYLSQRMQEGMDASAQPVAKAKDMPTPGEWKRPTGPFFEPQFYNYITQKFALPLDSYHQFGYDETTVANEFRRGTDFYKSNKNDNNHGQQPSPREIKQPNEKLVAEIDLQKSRNAFTAKAIEDFRVARKTYGWCPENQYCLGFTHAFEPLRPTFTNILLTLIASQKPLDEVEGLIRAMSKSHNPVPIADLANCPGCDNAEKRQKFQECICNRQQDVELQMIENASEDCQLRDRREILQQIRAEVPESLHLHCLEQQMKESLGGDSSAQATTRVGLLRAAVADFLFNYKWATQYPHDFVPYDLSQSAQELNAEFNPLILEFNRDVAAFTENLQKELQCKQDVSESHSWFGNGDESFLNDAMVAVRGISGVESIVDTVTQSFFNATNPPSLTDLVKSVSDAESKIPGVLKTNLTANEAAVLLGALNSVQPAEAKIGRQLKVDITPHAMAGASAAELDVKLTAEESAAPTRFTADKSAEDNLSRVAKHDTTTKVRVDSLKLFEVSAFSAMLQRPRSKFPILPPFFEVPYFGSFIAYPIPGAKVYHRSSAIVSAIIVPTAADLAYGIDFTADRVCETNLSYLNSIPGNWQSQFRCHTAASPSDFFGLPLRNFNKAIVQCFATSQNTAFTGLLALSQEVGGQNLQDKMTERGRCMGLTFESIPWPD